MKSRCEGKAERGKTAGNMAGLIKQIQDRFGGNILYGWWRKQENRKQNSGKRLKSHHKSYRVN